MDNEGRALVNAITRSRYRVTQVLVARPAENLEHQALRNRRQALLNRVIQVRTAPAAGYLEYSGSGNGQPYELMPVALAVPRRVRPPSPVRLEGRLGLRSRWGCFYWQSQGDEVADALQFWLLRHPVRR